jgi:hypothetical protein
MMGSAAHSGTKEQDTRVQKKEKAKQKKLDQRKKMRKKKTGIEMKSKGKRE